MLNYRAQGQGTPLVLLHAFPLSSKMWDAQIEYLSRDFKVIAPDFPGFGKSTLQPEASMASMAQDVAKLLDSLKISEPVILAGLSMGGYVSFEFLRQFPKRLRALALFATRAAADSPTAKENRFKSIEAMEKFGLEAFIKKAVKSQLGKTTQEKNPDLIMRALDIMKENKVEAAIAGQRAMAARRDSSDLLASIKFPVLVVAGEEDEICPAPEMRAMHEKIIGSEFHAVPQSGHLINLEQPEIFKKNFQNFLTKLS